MVSFPRYILLRLSAGAGRTLGKLISVAYRVVLCNEVKQKCTEEGESRARARMRNKEQRA